MICSSVWRRVGVQQLTTLKNVPGPGPGLAQLFFKPAHSLSRSPPTPWDKTSPFLKTTALGFSLLINPVWVLLCELCSPPSCMHSGKWHAKGIMSGGLQGNKDSETWLFTVIVFQCVKKIHLYACLGKTQPWLATFPRTWPAGTINSCM